MERSLRKSVFVGDRYLRFTSPLIKSSKLSIGDYLTVHGHPSQGIVILRKTMDKDNGIQVSKVQGGHGICGVHMAKMVHAIVGERPDVYVSDDMVVLTKGEENEA